MKDTLLLFLCLFVQAALELYTPERLFAAQK
jgi:hypothetical protein